MSGNAKFYLFIYNLRWVYACLTSCCLFKESKKYVTERITVDTKRADFILERLGQYAREAKTSPEDLE